MGKVLLNWKNIHKPENYYNKDYNDKKNEIKNRKHTTHLKLLK